MLLVVSFRIYFLYIVLLVLYNANAHWGLGEIDGLLVSPGKAC